MDFSVCGEIIIPKKIKDLIDLLEDYGVFA